jgi:CBS domain-containing protein
MNIIDIAVPDYIEVESDERLGKIRSIFERENPRGLIVVDDDGYAGVIGEKQLVQSHIDDDTKAAALMQSAPKIDRREDVREAARMLVEGNTQIAPVYEGEKLWGIITGDAILEAVIDNLDALTVDQIYTDDVVTVSEEDRVGKVINLLREHGISRLPVVNENGKLTGVVTTHDIVDFVVRKMNRQGKGDRRGDIDRMLDLPVYDLMSSPVFTTTPGEKVDDAVAKMFERDIAGLVVTPTDSDSEVIGVLTKTDVLRALTYTEEEQMDVQVTNIDLVDTMSREALVQSITEVVDKYQEMQVHHAHVRFHEHKEKLRGTPLIQAQVRLRTSHGQVAGSGEGYGAEHAFRVALDKLERNVLELKGLNADEEYRGQLLRKLGEL